MNFQKKLGLELFFKPASEWRGRCRML